MQRLSVLEEETHRTTYIDCKFHSLAHRHCCLALRFVMTPARAPGARYRVMARRCSRIEFLNQTRERAGRCRCGSAFRHDGEAFRPAHPGLFKQHRIESGIHIHFRLTYIFVKIADMAGKYCSISLDEAPIPNCSPSDCHSA